MTISEAIKHCLEVAEEQSRLYSLCPCPCDGTDNCMSLENGKDMGCVKCAADHRQLAEWLTELIDSRAVQNEQEIFIHKLMSKLEEAKRLLKLAVDDVHELLCDRDDVSRGKGQACRTCSHIMHCSCCEQCTVKEELRHWRYADEAEKLIKEEK